MNYYQARQVQATGKWHYTCMNDGRIWPVGRCSPYQNCPECKGNCFSLQPMTKEHCDKHGIKFCETCKNTGTIKTATPCPGHDTAEEACEHFRQYQLDGVRYHTSDSEQHKCAVCKQWTQKYALIGGYEHYDLCEEHCNRETLEKIHPASTGSMES